MVIALSARPNAWALEAIVVVHSHCSFPNSKNRTRKGSGWPSAIRCLPQTVLELPQQYSCPQGFAEVLGGPQPNFAATVLRGLTYNEVCHVLVCAAVVRAGVPGYLVLARCGDDGFDSSRIAVVPAPMPVLGRFSNDCSHQSKTMRRRALPHRNLLERAPRAHDVLDPVSTDAGPQPRRATPILPEVVPSLWTNARLRGGTPHERFVLT